jgi:hypothetical protein
MRRPIRSERLFGMLCTLIICWPHLGHMASIYIPRSISGHKCRFDRRGLAEDGPVTPCRRPIVTEQRCLEKWTTWWRKGRLVTYDEKSRYTPTVFGLLYEGRHMRLFHPSLAAKEEPSGIR